MKSNYKPLGNYIQPVNVRNKDLKVDRLLGVSVKKQFIPSIANTVGTNFKNYKLVKKHQFVYIPDTSRRGDKIGIAMLEEYEKAIVSQAYTVFEIIDKTLLNPEYLMMWFRRPEFDRYARFKSHGSVREIFDWEEVCDIELPIPSIEKQNAIVKEYNTVVNRIKLNEQLNQKLEETAQALYKHWFVDFEFPNEQDKPYKSSGGKLEYNEELDMDIPEGWEVEKLEDLCSLSQGIQVNTDIQFPSDIDSKLKRFIRIIDYTDGTIEPPRYVDIHESRYFVDRKDIVVIRYGDAGTICRRIEGIIANNLFKVNPHSINNQNLLYYFLKSTEIQQIIKGSSSSSTMASISHGTIKDLTICLPNMYLINKFNQIAEIVEENLVNNIDEILKLKELKDLLLSKMTKVESEMELVK